MPHDQVCTCKAAVTECFMIKGITFHTNPVCVPASDMYVPHLKVNMNNYSRIYDTLILHATVLC